LFIGQLVSQTCDKMMSVGLVWMFTEQYPTWVIPAFLGVSALPHLLLAWSAGRWTSRLGTVRTLVSTDAFRGGVFTLLALAWSRIAWPAAVLFGVSLVANLASALFNPAVMSAPVALVEAGQVQRLTALLESCFSIGTVVGPLIAALLYPHVGLAGLFLFNGLSYLGAALMESGLHPTSDTTDQPTLRSPREVLAADGVVAVLLAGFLASNLFLTPMTVIMPLYARGVFHGTISTLAVLEMCFGGGTIVGGLSMAARHVSKIGRQITFGMIWVALAWLGFTASPALGIGAICLAFLGYFLSTTNVLSMTVFQQRLPAPDVPTLMSLVNLISVACLPLSMLVMGALAPHFDIRTLALGCALGLLIATGGVVARRDVRVL
jgi:MFS family permease